jgi:L-2-hydroxycarboxylate dehydrogenase (NAD+)
MKVKIGDIRKTLVTIILAKGKFFQHEADILANDFLNGELQGKNSHGLTAFLAFVPILGEERQKFEILKETDAFLYVEAHKNFGAIVGRQVTDMLLEKAKIQGSATAIIRNMKSWLRPAIISQYIADHDCLSIVVNTAGPPMVAPPGGKEPVIGTNPIGIGIPSDNMPTVVDMATATRAWGEVRDAKRFHHELPPNSFIDQNGTVTLDPDCAHAAIPFGGYKGFGLGLLIEILGGSLADMPMGKGDPHESYYTRTRGAAIFVINPEFTVGAKKFKKENKSFIDSIRNSPPASNIKVTIPGDRAIFNRNKHIKEGYIDIDEYLWKEIKNL